MTDEPTAYAAGGTLNPGTKHAVNSTGETEPVLGAPVQADSEQADQPVDEQIDTTNGDRDLLSTDDGLQQAAENMPAIPEGRTDEDKGNPGDGQPADAPGLQVEDDGNDPLAGLGQPGTQED